MKQGDEFRWVAETASETVTVTKTERALER